MLGTRLPLALGLACACVLVLAGSAVADNLVANGSFETGLDGWVQYDPAGTYTYPDNWGDVNGVGSASGYPWTGVGHREDQGYGTFFPHDGNAEYAFGAYFPMPVSNPTVLYQDIATTPGQEYLVSFWIQHSNVSDPGTDVYMNGHFAGVETLNLVGGVTFFEGVGPGGGMDANIMDHDYAWRFMTQYTTTVTATGTTSRLEFQGYNNNNDYWHLDDVSVTPVPEPFTVTLAAVGGLALLRRRRK